MARRFGAAATTAVALHATLLALTLVPHRSEAPRPLDAAPPTATEVEVSILADDDLSAARRDQGTPMARQSDRNAERSATAVRPRSLAQQSKLVADADVEPAPASGSDSDAALAELDTGSEPGPSEGAPDGSGRARQRVDLGLDGTVLRHAVLDGRDHVPRAPRRRQVFALGHWSENTVRAVAQKSAPWDGRALLTLEWDATGQLLSVTSSGASSRGDEWQRLATDLRSKLAARPNTSPQGRGLRVVYLIKSDIKLPEDKRSLLPAARYASAEQLRADNLPPANAINLGVKADGGAAKTRVISVELVKSDAL